MNRVISLKEKKIDQMIKNVNNTILWIFTYNEFGTINLIVGPSSVRVKFWDMPYIGRSFNLGDYVFSIGGHSVELHSLNSGLKGPNCLY